MVSSLTKLCMFLPELLRGTFWQSKIPEFSDDKHPDQTDKVWIVTGSTSGLGYLVAKRLAELGAHVWLVGRSKERAEEYVGKLKSEVENANVDYLLIDLANLSSIKPGVAKFLESGSPLHGIVHNAAVMKVAKGSKTKQGWELTLGTNVIAPWLLQKLLDPVLLRSTTEIEGSIVWVSALLHVMASATGPELVKDPTLSIDPLDAYNVSKALNYMQCVQWSKAHPGANVRSTSCHPGVLDTNLSRGFSNTERKLSARLLAWPAYYGAITELHAAIGDLPNNGYGVPWGRVGVVRPDFVKSARVY